MLIGKTTVDPEPFGTEEESNMPSLNPLTLCEMRGPRSYLYLRIWETCEAADEVRYRHACLRHKNSAEATRFFPHWQVQGETLAVRWLKAQALRSRPGDWRTSFLLQSQVTSG